jgi:hypothetical protein
MQKIKKWLQRHIAYKEDNMISVTQQYNFRFWRLRFGKQRVEHTTKLLTSNANQNTSNTLQRPYEHSSILQFTNTRNILTRQPHAGIHIPLIYTLYQYA